MHTTERIVEFCQGLALEDVPPEVVCRATRCTIDLLGVALTGMATRSSEIARSYAIEHCGGGPCTLLGGRVGVQVLGATFANSISASSLDLDDGHRAAVGHPGAVVIPAMLAVAELIGASGKEFLEAVIVGYEVGIRVGAASSQVRSRNLSGLSTGTWGAYAAAAGAARLLRLDATEAAHALAIAGVHGPLAPLTGCISGGTMTKESIGWAAKTGVGAGLLAAKGLRGPLGILDDPTVFEQELLVDGLGERYAILSTYFKVHPSCRWSHAAIDAVLDLVRRYGIVPEEIRAIRVHTFREATALATYDPRSSEAVQYSIPYLVSMAVLEGGVFPDRIALTTGSEGQTSTFAKRVEIVVDPDHDRRFPQQVGAAVEIITSSDCWRKEVLYPKGDPQNPLDEKEIENRMLAFSASVLGRVAGERLLGALCSLPRAESMAAIGCLLRGEGPAP
jgi:2-methylcitrate dehydratase PrpD